MAGVKAWITINGQHIPIMEGQSKDDAIKNFTARQNEVKKENDEKQRQIDASKKQAEIQKRAEDKNASMIDNFDIKSLGPLKDADDVDEFIDKNLSNRLFKQFGANEGLDSIRQLWYEMKRQEEIKNLHEMSMDDAIDKITDSIKASHISGWFRNGDSSYKPRIAEQMFYNKGVLNASLNVAYHNYKTGLDKNEKPMDYKTWLYTPITVYRGTSGQKLVSDDVFTSYTPDKKIAENFAYGKDGATGSQHGGEPKVSSMQLRPIDTWGQMSTNGELEYMVPLTIESKSDRKERKK